MTGQDTENIYQFSLLTREFTTLLFSLPTPEDNHKLFSWLNSLFVIEHDKVWQLSEDGAL